MSTASLADDGHDTSAPDALVAVAWTELGSCSVGAIVSRTMTLNDSVVVLPCASVTLHVTVVDPTAKVEPEAVTHAGVRLPRVATWSVRRCSKVLNQYFWIFQIFPTNRIKTQFA